jgi:Zn-dependent peptidase ImmA (M78 family)
MPLNLIKLATQHGIVIEYWDFASPLQGVYWAPADLPSVIGLSKALFESRARFRCVLAEELGHYFTTVENAIPCTHFHYRDRLWVSRVEYQALRWAALYLMPTKQVVQAFRDGARERWELAEWFEVTGEMVDFRLRLPDIGISRLSSGREA